jgi:hypothetical protein
MPLVLVATTLIPILRQAVVPECCGDDVMQQAHLLTQAAAVAGVEVCWQLQH